MKYTPVKDKKLIRDNYSNAIINMDDHAYSQYKIKKIQDMKAKEEIILLKNQINKIETDLNTMKSNLLEILNILQKN